MIKFFQILLKNNRHKDKKKNSLMALSINDLFEASVLVEFNALSSILDIVAPYNVIEFSGKTVNFNLFHNFLRFLFEDFPQIIV